MAVDLSWLPQGTPFGKLPLGMRVNNPGNIKYFKGLNYPGMVGPSAPGHTDQGDPQMTFDKPQSGMNAMSSLAMKKYRSGKRTAMDLIAGQRGWTPGNTAAAANVARSMGIDPNADLNLVDPQRMTAFLRALTSQEHGASSKLYGDDLYTNAATYAINGAPPGAAAPASRYVARNAANEVTNNGAPMATPIGGAPIAGGPVPLTPPTQRYSKLADALLASAAGAKPKNWGELLNSAGDLALGYTLGDKHDTQQKEYQGSLAKALSGASSPDAMAEVMIQSGNPDLVEKGASIKMAQSQANQPLKGKERFMTTPNGVMDLNTMQMVPGTAKETADDTITLNGRVLRRGEGGKYEEVYVSPPTPPKLEVADRKEIFEADEGAQAANNVIGSLDKALTLNDKAYSGPGAQTGGYITSMFGSERGVATEELQNVVLQQVLDNLKATFGAAPTEGERQILVEIQGSVNKAPEVRKRIFEGAKAAAERRLKFNQERSGALRSGEYYKPGYNPSAVSQDPNQPTPVKTQTIDPATGQAAQATPPQGGPAQPKSAEEYQALPPGTQYIAPDGSIRTKK